VHLGACPRGEGGTAPPVPLVSASGSGVWGMVPLLTGHRREGSGKRAMPLPQKRVNLSLEMAFFQLFWCILSGTFYPCPCQKNLEFSARSGDLVDAEYVLLGNSESLLE